MTLNKQALQQHGQEYIEQGSYREHQALWKLFDTDPEADRDFLFRQTQEHGSIKYYVLSKRIPEDTTGLWTLSSPKPYHPKLQQGQLLGFSLRANPVVTISKEGKKYRHDVVEHEKQQSGFYQLPKAERPLQQEIVKKSCQKWLMARAEKNGFEVLDEQLLVDGYYKHNSHSGRSKNVRFSSVDFEGVIRVLDLQLFQKTLFEGLGRSKSFGCGLMLIRRI
jgi:CRISPR system Cascade subunit CasE